MKLKGDRNMESYLRKYFINQPVKIKIVNSIRLLLSLTGFILLVPGFLEKEF